MTKHLDSGLQPEVSDSQQQPELGQIFQILGGVVSFILVLGVAYWAYQIIVRDVSGVPVIAASLEPMREAPEEPGGKAAENQGLSVNVIAEEATKENPESVLLAPRPVVLGLNDIPSAKFELEEKPLEDTASHSTNFDMKVFADRVVEQAKSSIQPGANLRSSSIEKALNEAMETEFLQAKEKSKDKDKDKDNLLSLRPRNRPNAIEIADGSIDYTLISREQRNNMISPGTPLVQLGAFESEQVANTQWSKLSRQFSSFLGERNKLIQRASSAGKVFYRLRATGFENLADARRLCAFLVAEGADCIPIISR